jgi:hypothetical protein
MRAQGGSVLVNEEESHFASSKESLDDVELGFRYRYRIRWRPARFRVIGWYIWFAVCQGIIFLFLAERDLSLPNSEFGFFMLVLISIAIVGSVPVTMGSIASENLYYGTLNEVDELALRILKYGVVEQVPRDFRRLYTRLANGNCAFGHDLLLTALTLASLYLLSQLQSSVFADGKSFDLRIVDLVLILFYAFELWESGRAYFLRRRWLKASDKEIIEWLKKKARDIKRTGKRAPWPPPSNISI